MNTDLNFKMDEKTYKDLSGVHNMMDELVEKQSRKAFNEMNKIFRIIVGDEIFDHVVLGGSPFGLGLEVKMVTSPDGRDFSSNGVPCKSGSTLVYLKNELIGVIYPLEINHSVKEKGQLFTGFTYKYWAKNEEKNES